MSIPSHELVIELPVLADAEAVTGLRIQYQQEALKQRGNTLRPGVAEAMRQAMREVELEYLGRRLLRPNAFLRVARVSGACVAYMNAELFRPREHDAYLSFLMVAPDYRSQGLGGRLVNEFEAALPPGVPISVDAVSANQAAVVRFYERLGFERLDVDSQASDDHRMIKMRREQS